MRTLLSLYEALDHWFQYLNLAGDVALLAALAWRKLAGVYPVLIVYFLLDLLEAVAAYGLGEQYQLPLYYSFQALKWALAFWFVLDLYGRILSPYAALAKFGRGTVGGLLALSIAASVPTFFVELNRPFEPDHFGFLMNRFERIADLTIAVLVVLMSIFLIWYPVKVRRNVAAYMAGFAVDFSARALALTGIDWWRQYYRQIDAAMLAVAFGCMLFWILVMRPEGEVRTMTGHGWNEDEAHRLSRQLDEINDRLERLLH
ncbi:MAG TPA: hypothetical protein VGN17_17740 [Bryobacteraceae bacterium]